MPFPAGWGSDPTTDPSYNIDPSSNPDKMRKALSGAGLPENLQQQEGWQGPTSAQEQQLSQAAANGMFTQDMKGAGGQYIGNAGAQLSGMTGLEGHLNDTIAGKGLSAAGAQLKQGQEQSMEQALALAGRSRGQAMGSALTSAQRTNAETEAHTNQQAATLRAQESATAAGQLGGLLGQHANTNLALAANQQNLAQNMDTLNLQGTMGFNTAAQQSAMGQLQANEAMVNQAMAAEGISTQEQLANMQMGTQMIGGLASAAGGVGAVLSQPSSPPDTSSDIGAKQDIGMAGGQNQQAYGQQMQGYQQNSSLNNQFAAMGGMRQGGVQGQRMMQGQQQMGRQQVDPRWAREQQMARAQGQVGLGQMAPRATGYPMGAQGMGMGMNPMAALGGFQGQSVGQGQAPEAAMANRQAAGMGMQAGSPGAGLALARMAGFSGQPVSPMQAAGATAIERPGAATSPAMVPQAGMANAAAAQSARPLLNARPGAMNVQVAQAGLPQQAALGAAAGMMSDTATKTDVESAGGGPKYVPHDSTNSIGQQLNLLDAPDNEDAGSSVNAYSQRPSTPAPSSPSTAATAAGAAVPTAGGPKPTAVAPDQVQANKGGNKQLAAGASALQGLGKQLMGAHVDPIQLPTLTTAQAPQIQNNQQIGANAIVSDENLKDNIDQAGGNDPDNADGSGGNPLEDTQAAPAIKANTTAPVLSKTAPVNVQSRPQAPAVDPGQAFMAAGQAHQAQQAQQNLQALKMAKTAAMAGLSAASHITIPVFSDEKLKEEKSKGEDVPGGHTVADGFLDALARSASTYRYKDPSYEPTNRPTGGKYLGIMAQEVEKSPTGDTLIKDTPRGKMVEGGAALSAALAGLGRLHERLSEVESQLGDDTTKKAIKGRKA